MSDQIKFNDLFNAQSFDDGTKEIARYIGLITEQIGEAKKAADTLTIALGAELKKEISQLSTQSKTLAKDMADMANKMANFQQTTSNTKKVLSDYEKENEKLRKELEKLKVAQEGTTKATKASGTAFTTQLQSMLGLASGAAIVYRGITILTEQFKLALKSTMEFEVAMKAVQAISRASAEEIDQLAANANKLGATTEKTAGEIANLQKELAKLGFDPTEIIATTSSIVDLATATGEDLVGAGIVAAATLRAFGLEATEMGRVTDVMTGSFVRSGLDLEKFRESMKLVAPIAKATGVELEVVTASLSKLADTGISGSLAGTAMRNLLSSMADPSEKLTQLLGKLDSTLKGGIKTSEDFSRALVVLKESNIDLEHAVGMVDVRARSAFFTLVDQADAIQTLTLEYKLLNGETAKTASIMRDTLANDLDIANSAFDALRRNIMENFTPSIRNVTQGVTTFIEYLRFLVVDLGTASAQMDKFGLTALKTYGLLQPFVDLYNAMFKGMEDTVKLRTTQEALASLDSDLLKVGNSLKGLNTEFSRLEQVKEVINSGKFENIIKLAEDFGSEYTDVVIGMRDGIITASEGADILKGRLEGNLKTTKQQYDITKLAHEQLKKDIATNEKIREVERAKWAEKGTMVLADQTAEQKAHNKRMEHISDELSDMKFKDVAYKNFLKNYEKEAALLLNIKVAKVKAFDPNLIDESESDAKKRIKALQDTLKLEQQLKEEKIKGQIEILKLEEKYATNVFDTEDAQTKIYAKELELLRSKLDYELKAIETSEASEQDSLLKRELAWQKYYNEVIKLGGKLSTEQTKVQIKAEQEINKEIEELKKDLYKSLEVLDASNYKKQKARKKKDVDDEKEKWDEITKIAQAAADGLGKITSFAFDNRQVARENELRAIDAWEQERLKMAGDNEDAKAIIEKEAEKKRQAIAIQQARDNKKEAMFQIVLSTAVAVMRTLEKGAGFFSTPLAIITAALGAAQLAVVANRPLPQFYKGTEHSPEGFAKVGERGRELVQDGRTKKWSLTPDKTTVAYLTKGSKVITNAETERVLAQDHNGRANQFLQSKVIVKDNNKINYKMMGQEFKSAVSTIPVNITNFDEKGVTKYVMKRSSKITRLNKRY
jgi:TP901 family phage tail tape measure protein